MEQYSRSTHTRMFLMVAGWTSQSCNMPLQDPFVWKKDADLVTEASKVWPRQEIQGLGAFSEDLWPFLDVFWYSTSPKTSTVAKSPSFIAPDIDGKAPISPVSSLSKNLVPLTQYLVTLPGQRAWFLSMVRHRCWADEETKPLDLLVDQ